MQVLKEAGRYDDTLILYLSDHGIAMPGAKTTVYEPGLRSPLIVRHPGAADRGAVTGAMVSWVDIAPTILDFAGGAEPTYRQQVQSEGIRMHLPDEHGLHGRSFLGILEGDDETGFDRIYASHTFHEIQMYYPMRVVRDRQYKLIWNVAHDLPFPSPRICGRRLPGSRRTGRGRMRATGSAPWRTTYTAPNSSCTTCARSVGIEKSGVSSEYAEVLAAYRDMLWDFEVRTSDPWLLKQEYE